jgi:L-lactate dehydrogenase
MKVGIVGAGQVGAACFLSMVMRGSAREVVLVNRDRKRAKGIVTDVQYGAVLSPPITLRDGDYSDLAGSSVVMITAGVNEKGGGATDRSDPVGRLRLLDANAAIFQDIVPQIHHFAPDTLILVVSDPPDALADVVRGTRTRAEHWHISRHATVPVSPGKAPERQCVRRGGIGLG